MGLATAKLLASHGGVISLADINQDALREAAKSLPFSDRHICTVVDVRNFEHVNTWISSTVTKFGKLDCAVNMAGVITKATSITQMSEDDWDFCFAVNTKGVMNCLKAQINAMGSGGSIVSEWRYSRPWLSSKAHL